MKISKTEQLNLLKCEGFNIPPFSTYVGTALSESLLSQFVNDRRSDNPYEIDGIVLDVDNYEKRSSMHQTTDTLNPAYAIKYKVADASNLAITEVLGVTWNLSKHGFLKPQVNVKPVNISGVTISNATGFNAKFIMENKIGKGALIKITRSGDVIPFIIGVESPAEHPSLPDCDYVWTDTGVDIYVEDSTSIKEVIVAQAVDFFTSINVTNIKEGVINQMIEEYKYANVSDCLVAMLSYRVETWNKIVGKNGGKIHSSIQEALSGGLSIDQFLGALPFFGRGVGQRKFKKLVSTLHITSIEDVIGLAIDDIISVDGFDETTAVKIVNGKDAMVRLIDELRDNFIEICFKDAIVAASSGKLLGQKIVMTGFRDDDLAKRIEMEGGENQNSFTSATTIVLAKDPNSTSGKLTKAREKNVPIKSKEQFIKWLELM